MLIEFIIILVITTVTFAVFTHGFRQSGPWPGWLWFFLTLFLGTWAIGRWTTPIGPALWGVFWVPYLVGSVFIALLLSAAGGTQSKESIGEPQEIERDAEAESRVVFGVTLFFWLMLLLALLTITASYALRSAAEHGPNWPP